MTKWHSVIGLGVLVILALVIAVYVPGEPLQKLQMTAGYAALILVFGYGVAVLAAIVGGTIKLDDLLEEVDGGASMSRFQLLIFIFVIGFSFIFIVLQTNKFPSIPVEVLTLLGISASTYAVSKGIQAGMGSSSGEPPKKDDSNAGK